MEEFSTVHYPNKEERWYYFTVARPQGLPIKVSATSPEVLQPIYDGIADFLDREAKLKKKRMEEKRERMQQQNSYERETYY